MNYHIGTMLIKEHFDGGKDCPVCRIKHSVDIRLTEQYLGEGVMEDHTRAEVNKLGFCCRHFPCSTLCARNSVWHCRRQR